MIPEIQRQIYGMHVMRVGSSPTPINKAGVLSYWRGTKKWQQGVQLQSVGHKLLRHSWYRNYVCSASLQVSWPSLTIPFFSDFKNRIYSSWHCVPNHVNYAKEYKSKQQADREFLIRFKTENWGKTMPQLIRKYVRNKQSKTYQKSRT